MLCFTVWEKEQSWEGKAQSKTMTLKGGKMRQYAYVFVEYQETTMKKAILFLNKIPNILKRKWAMYMSIHIMVVINLE